MISPNAGSIGEDQHCRISRRKTVDIKGQRPVASRRDQLFFFDKNARLIVFNVCFYNVAILDRQCRVSISGPVNFFAPELGKRAKCYILKK